MEINLQISQQQKLIITQRMQTSLNILQMSTMELREYIEKELETNIALEYLEDNNSFSNGSNYYEGEAASPFLFVSQQQTFRQYLVTQVIEQVRDEQLKDICFHIIEELDENGFFRISTKDVARIKNVEEEKVEQALTIIQQFEPIGVGAKNVKHYLELQVNHKNPKEKQIVLILIHKYLEDIANYQYKKISKELNISLGQLQQCIDFIKSLEPKPTRGFYTGEVVQYVVADAFIKRENKQLQVIMNDAYLPRLSIQTCYKNMLKDDIDLKSKEYIQKHIQNALFLIKNINDRKRTVYKILEAITYIQRDYFNGESNYVKPMTLKDIAEIVNIHESTVSRAIQDKYIDIETKIVCMKELFAQGIYQKHQNQEIEMNVEEIKDAIYKMISEENKRNPLSDQDICQLLEAQNMNISRRTVAKYRQSMGIASSTKRKQF